MIRLRAPASVANLGPGFDCAAFAVDLWNELEVVEGEGVTISGPAADGIPCDLDNVALQAFAALAPLDGLRFSFLHRIPVGRGLGSSAAAVALGLVAGALFTGCQPDTADLLELGAPIEGHADNLAAALAGGVCLTWKDGGKQRLAPIASDLPLIPLAVLPEERFETVRARRALPPTISHPDAVFTAGRAALLGAALTAGDGNLLAGAFEDRVHEPYRAQFAPLLERLRASPPPGCAGTTLAGSGPSVIVWSRPADAPRCRAALERSRHGRVLQLRVARVGACDLTEDNAIPFQTQEV